MEKKKTSPFELTQSPRSSPSPTLSITVMASCTSFCPAPVPMHRLVLLLVTSSPPLFRQILYQRAGDLLGASLTYSLTHRWPEMLLQSPAA